MKKKAPAMPNFKDETFQKRISEKYEELYYYYNSIYHNDEMFTKLINMIYDLYQKRTDSLKQLDNERKKDPKWFCKNDSIGIQIYTEKFAGNLLGIESKLDYLQKLGIKFVYALPFLDSPPGKSDGGLAVSNYRKVRQDLGTIEDLQHLICTLHDRGMCLCMNFIINHTSDEHEWAKRAKRGEIEYQNRYYFYDSWYVPNQFDSYGVMGHFFGDLAPDNFTYVPECQKIVMTTFYPYQWDVNFTNPAVFMETLANVLYLANLGVDVLLFNGAPNMWKKPGTSCRMLKQTYVLNYIIFTVMQIVCPGVAAWIDVKRHKKRHPFETNIKLNEEQDSNERGSSSTDSEDQNNNKCDDDVLADICESDLCGFDDESESENEKEFIITESGVVTADTHAGAMKMSDSRHHMNDSEEEEESIDFDQSTEIGNIHLNFAWVARLWASLALCDVHSISYTINAICNRFCGDAYFTRVQSHDDINWGLGFDVESNSLIGKGLANSDGFQGDIITLYRYLNDYYTGNMPGSFSIGVPFAEDLVTGKARICGRTASLLGLEHSLREEETLQKLKKKKNSAEFVNKMNKVKIEIQESIDRIILLHSVSASMPSLFFIYYGDEIGKLNDYDAEIELGSSKDTRYLLRGDFNWDAIDLIEKDKDSYQSKIYNGIKSLIDARLKCPFFTENKKTVFIKSFSLNQYFNSDEDENEKNQKFEIDNGILIFKRIRNNGNFLLFIFNFCKYQRSVRIFQNDICGKFKEMITDRIFDQVNDFKIKGYGFLWLEPIQ